MPQHSQISRRLRLRDLHYLMTVVQTGSMAKAATILSVSQPVISKVIADMEHILGERMLDRSPRGVEPTIYGRKLLETSFAVFDELRHGVVEIEHLLDPTAGELAIGSNEASTLSIVPEAIQLLRAKHPRSFIRVVLANTPEEQRQALARRDIELTIGRVWPHLPSSEFETEILYDEQYVVVAAPDNPWRNRSLVELSELVDHPWIVPSFSNLSGQLIAEIFRQKGLELPRGPVRTSSMQLAQHLLEQGSFVAMLPASALPSLAAMSSLVALPVPLPDLASPVGIMRLRTVTPGPIAEAFTKAARAVTRTMEIRTHGPALPPR
ncbi:LysR family transcriptional regulator [Novosphingobium flavum]|uniref:LysR family transcriptional regulator n=1 Tax=Novosphingobium flavum TaxID=1778672 RepID=A0A7X1FU24_9SPHN|nr:LysR family transcriptional regulator [Novosphingobium flavum]MBC2667000.1 LysR family transcriptional regulator [Novosphingobium flavum]